MPFNKIEYILSAFNKRLKLTDIPFLLYVGAQIPLETECQFVIFPIPFQFLSDLPPHPFKSTIERHSQEAIMSGTEFIADLLPHCLEFPVVGHP